MQTQTQASGGGPGGGRRDVGGASRLAERAGEHLPEGEGGQHINRAGEIIFF